MLFFYTDLLDFCDSDKREALCAAEEQIMQNESGNGDYIETAADDSNGTCVLSFVLFVIVFRLSAI
jgi:hypothetical protein